MTTQAQHTPAPWHFVTVPYKEHSDGSYTVPHSKVVPAGLEAFTIYDGSDLPVIQSERTANAHLIAAAPDLLAALEAVMQWWTETPAFQDGDDDMPAAVFDAARAAIAKARGQA